MAGAVFDRRNALLLGVLRPGALVSRRWDGPRSRRLAGQVSGDTVRASAGAAAP